MRARQAAVSARARGMRTLAQELRAIARDPVTYEFDLERRAEAARSAAAPAPADPQGSPSRPLPDARRRIAGEGEAAWIDRTFEPGRDLGTRPW